jgi:hypothetical protein
MEFGVFFFPLLFFLDFEESYIVLMIFKFFLILNWKMNLINQ